MNVKFSVLKALGAGEFEHLNGSLIKHLKSTYQLLTQWNASPALCDAGLYHAAYGTDGFESQVVSLQHRSDIAAIIGNTAEEIVYLYCSCDREFVFNRFDSSNPINFRDRFTTKEFELSAEQALYFCELTVANELELAIDSYDFLKAHGQGLLNLFTKMRPFLSEHANEAVQRVLTR